MYERKIRIALRLVVTSIALTLAVWLWILTRPEGTLHDQGGMMITFVFFPATFGGFLFLAIPAAILACVSMLRAPGSKRPAVGVLGLAILALLLSVATLFIA